MKKKKALTARDALERVVGGIDWASSEIGGCAFPCVPGTPDCESIVEFDGSAVIQCANEKCTGRKRTTFSAGLLERLAVQMSKGQKGIYIFDR